MADLQEQHDYFKVTRVESWNSDLLYRDWSRSDRKITSPSRVQEPIQPNQEIYLSYLDTTLPSKSRTNELQKNYGFLCDCKGCHTKDLDQESQAGGDLEQLIQAGQVDAIENLPAYNIGVLQRLQRAFDDAIRYDRDPNKAYDIGERLIKGMSYYLDKKKDSSRPDFRRACGIQYMFMGELSLTLTKDPRLTQAYFLGLGKNFFRKFSKKNFLTQNYLTPPPSLQSRRNPKNHRRGRVHSLQSNPQNS